MTTSPQPSKWSADRSTSAAAPPKQGGELMHGPEPRTHRVRWPPLAGAHSTWWVPASTARRPSACRRSNPLPTAGLAGSVPISPRPQAGRTSAGTIRPQPDQRWSQGSNANARHRTVADSVEPIDADHSRCRTVSDGLDTGRACLLIRRSRVRALEGRHPALGAPHLIAEIHRVLATYYDRRTGARPPGIDQAAHALPDVPVRELGRVRPPVRDILMRGSPGLRRLLFLHHAPLTQPKLSTKHRSEQYRAEQIYHMINSDLW